VEDEELQTSAPTVLELVPSGSDGLSVNIPDFKIVPGKIRRQGLRDGPRYATGLTLAIRKTGPRSFDVTETQNGKPLMMLSFTVSDDGKTLTETGGPVGVSEKFKAVYDRQ
jgi:hypothetical protein